MSVRERLSFLFPRVEAAIAELGSEFDSHAFIEKFAHMNEVEYVTLLAQNNRPGVFRMVHSEMAKFLSLKQEDLRIRKTEQPKDLTRNVFGTDSPAERWAKQ